MSWWKNRQKCTYIAKPIFWTNNPCLVPWEKSSQTICDAIVCNFQKSYPKATNRPTGEISPNLVTLM
jgi:hypothetical protein